MTSYTTSGTYQVFIKSSFITIISSNNKIYKLEVDDADNIFSNKDIIIEESNNKLIVKTNYRKIYIPEIINEYDFRDIQIAEMKKMIIEMNKKIEMLENELSIIKNKVNVDSSDNKSDYNDNSDNTDDPSNKSDIIDIEGLSLFQKYNFYKNKLMNNSSDYINLCIFNNYDINYEEYGVAPNIYNYFLDKCSLDNKYCLCNNRNLKILHITKYESLLINCDKNIKHNIVNLGTMPIDNTDNNDFYYYLTKYNKYFDKWELSDTIKNAGIQFLENLEELYINIPFEVFSLNLLSDMKKLKKLSFCFCILGNLENIVILNNLETLEELSFKYIKNNLHLEMFINKCKLHKLKKIEIIGCSNIIIGNPKLYSDKGITLIKV
jgi:hypothetical protein